MDPRTDRLAEPHCRPLMALIETWRLAGLQVPNIDPNDGGIDAVALFLLESPGPKAVDSGFVSRDNPDPSARNMGRLLDGAGFARQDVLLWNVVPHCISTTERNQNATSKQIRGAVPLTRSLIDHLPKIRVIVFCGRRAQIAQSLVTVPDKVHVLSTFHPGAQSYNHERCRAHMEYTFQQAHALSKDFTD